MTPLLAGFNILCGAGIPTGANVLNANVTITTQTQLNSFFSTVSGTNYGKRWTKINGKLTIDGSSTTDPITYLCNLGSLTEVTKSLEIVNFTQAGNPTNLNELANLATVGCWVYIYNCPSLIDITYPKLTTVGCSFKVEKNANAKVINMPWLQSVQGDKLIIKNNPKLESLSLSTSAASFNFTGGGSSVEVSDNGNTASNPLAMNLKKITTVKGALIFNNNDNTGVSNFDNIFTGLSSLSTNWGKLVITNNDYLATCCIAATVTVGGTGKRHIISGNTGNCIDSATVLANCGVFHKRSLNSGTKGMEGIRFNVYPNPNKGNFGLDIKTSESGTLKLVVTDLMGRTIIQQIRK